jgi:hypothetical protein
MGEQAQVLEFGEPAWILAIWTDLEGSSAEGYITSILATAKVPTRLVEVGCECGQCASRPAVEMMYPASERGRVTAISRVESFGGKLVEGDTWESENVSGGRKFFVRFHIYRGVWRAVRYERLLARLDAVLDRLHGLSDDEFERIVTLLEREL